MPPPSLRVERIPTLRDNYTYLIIDSETAEAAVVDAPEAGPVIARVDALGVRVVKVLSTHHHPDHSAANPELATRYRVPVFGHEADAARLPGFTNGVVEGDRVSIRPLEAEVVFIPAHTRGPAAWREGRATNPSMGAHWPVLGAGVRARMPEAPADPAGILGAVRALKDKF